MEHAVNILIVIASVVIFLVTWFTLNPGQNIFSLILWLIATSLLGAIFGLIIGLPVDSESLNFMGIVTAGIQVTFFAFIMKTQFKMEFNSSYWSVLGAFSIAALVFNLIPV